jgi:hypothetical protein
MKLRIYIDTSVVGGYFDSMFADDTKSFFEKVKETNSILIISQLLEAEVSEAPQNVRDFFATLQNENAEYIKVTQDAKDLAQMYIKEKVVGESSLSDCEHIGSATVHNASVLVSWNFKHIVNLPRIRGYNSINIREGYQNLEIRTPKEVFNND